MTLKGRIVKLIFEVMDKWRDRGLTTPADIHREDNLQYGKDSKWQRLDVYRPRGVEQRLPTIINVHGGGWVYGHKEAYQYYCMALSQKGFAVVNFTYRLAPMHRFPAQLEDLNEVVKWVMTHHENYGLDTTRIYLVGDSAGAHMTSLYASLCTGGIKKAGVGMHYESLVIPEGFFLKGLGLNCGVYDMTKSNHHGLFGFAPLLKDLLGDIYEKADLAHFDSIHFVDTHYPPTFLATSNGDFLKHQAFALRDKLEEQQVNYEFKVYGSLFNVLFHVFHLDIRSQEAQNAMMAMCEFFKKIEAKY